MDFFFFFNDTATTEIYTLSLHDALPISPHAGDYPRTPVRHLDGERDEPPLLRGIERSEEHTSELQSPCNLVCRLLLEKKKKYNTLTTTGLWTNGQQNCELRQTPEHRQEP